MPPQYPWIAPPAAITLKTATPIVKNEDLFKST